MNKQEAYNLVYSSDLCSSSRQVMCYLILRSNKEGTCFPSIRKISADTNLSPRTVQRKLRILEDRNYIKCESRTAEYGRKTSNLYTIVIKETVCQCEQTVSDAINIIDLEELINECSTLSDNIDQDQKNSPVQRDNIKQAVKEIVEVPIMNVRKKQMDEEHKNSFSISKVKKHPKFISDRNKLRKGYLELLNIFIMINAILVSFQKWADCGVFLRTNYKVCNCQVNNNLYFSVGIVRDYKPP